MTRVPRVRSDVSAATPAAGFPRRSTVARLSLRWVSPRRTHRTPVPGQAGAWRRLGRVVRAITGIELGVAALATAMIFVLVLVQAFQRYLPVDGWTWTGELSRYGLVWLTFVAAGVLVTRDGHIALQMVDTQRPAAGPGGPRPRPRRRGGHRRRLRLGLLDPDPGVGQPDDAVAADPDVVRLRPPAGRVRQHGGPLAPRGRPRRPLRRSRPPGSGTPCRSASTAPSRGRAHDRRPAPHRHLVLLLSCGSRSPSRSSVPAWPTSCSPTSRSGWPCAW